jgi:3-hydroxybutyrate dehydrogenase
MPGKAQDLLATSQLAGRAAVVTGSTSGIGLAIAEALASAGAHVCINGFGKPDEIEVERARLESTYGVKAIYSAADMSKPAQVTQMIADAAAAFGQVDILVDNAGIQFVSAVDEFPDEKWEAILAINLSSNFYAIKAVVPGMKARNWGRIINIASAHGLRASPFKSAYVAAKHGVLGLTKCVALELAETDITVNAICPGYVKTPLVEGQIKDQAKVHNMSEEQVVKQVILASQPNKKFLMPEEIGAMVLFLCSDAGRSMTGEIISMDGGWTAR